MAGRMFLSLLLDFFKCRKTIFSQPPLNVPSLVITVQPQAEPRPEPQPEPSLDDVSKCQVPGAAVGEMGRATEAQVNASEDNQSVLQLELELELELDVEQEQEPEPEADAEADDDGLGYDDPRLPELII
ncbi:hypothetical protein AWZ03_013989 [Drosophila navojoa]|uniref:Uncharacterized protein n=1 Tax=Drosophila navojoa TaxID=7232 RepID=A0A484AT79_DRONA|nr:hypothetical protein AWZ03_013989 [Drosophila navojoa]